MIVEIKIFHPTRINVRAKQYNGDEGSSDFVILRIHCDDTNIEIFMRDMAELTEFNEKVNDAIANIKTVTSAED